MSDRSRKQELPCPGCGTLHVARYDRGMIKQQADINSLCCDVPLIAHRTTRIYFAVEFAAGPPVSAGGSQVKTIDPSTIIIHQTQGPISCKLQ